MHEAVLDFWFGASVATDPAATAKARQALWWGGEAATDILHYPKQRVAIARTLAVRPAIVLMDYYLGDERGDEALGVGAHLVLGDGEEKLRVAQDRLTYWRGVGAQASPTVERLLKAGVLPATAPAAA